MRSTREENESAVDRYSSISWSPAAKESSVGARSVVILERRAETSAGDIDRKAFSEVELSPSAAGLDRERDL